MNRAFKLTAFVCAMLIVLLGCTTTLTPNNVHREAHFAAAVIEVFDNSILVRVNEGEEVLLSSDLVSVSLDVEMTGVTDYAIGDDVVVFYDGNIAESYPAQINKVYMISSACLCQRGR